MATLNPFVTARRIVLKIGSALLVDAGTGELKTGWLAALCVDIARLKAAHSLAVEHGNCLFIDTFGVDQVCFWHHDGGDIDVISEDIDLFESQMQPV